MKTLINFSSSFRTYCEKLNSVKDGKNGEELLTYSSFVSSDNCFSGRKL